MLNGGHLASLANETERGMVGNLREQRRPMWTQHEKTVLRLLMREYAGVTEFDPPDIHKHPIKNEMWRLLTARYNDHPNVRTRDTKQLRKAWENLKYRARKLGVDPKRNSGGGSGTLDTVNFHDVFDTPWPLDGVSLSLGRLRESREGESPGTDEDSKSVIIEEELHTPSWNEEPLKKSTWDEGPLKKSPRPSFECKRNREPLKSGVDESLKEPPNSIFNVHKMTGVGGDFADRRGAILNLQPLVTSLVGGALPALLPFLSPASQPPFPADILGASPFVSSLTPRFEECPSESSLPKDEVGQPPPPFDTPGQAWPSKDQKEVPLHDVKMELKEEDLHTEPEEDDDDVDTLYALGPEGGDVIGRTASDNVSRLLLRRAREEQRHLATLRLLRTQLSHAESQHEMKMKLLEAQLQYWQGKLKLQQEVVGEQEENAAENDP